MLFSILKLIHVSAAIVAVGANATYGIWLSRASRSTEVLPFTLRTIKLIDDRLANPAYGLQLVTGLIMAFIIPGIMPPMVPDCAGHPAASVLLPSAA